MKFDTPWRGLGRWRLSLLILVVWGSGCRVKCRPGKARMDERGPVVWKVEGKDRKIDRSWFEVDGGHLRFTVQWTCLGPECDQQRKIDQAQELRICRSVLWYAVINGEAARLRAGEVGGKSNLPVGVLRCMMRHRQGDKLEIVTTDIPAKATFNLFDQVWTIQGKKYHVYKIGFYFQTDGPRDVFLTLYWDAPELCGEMPGIAMDRALKLADPIMREVVARKLHVKLPRITNRDWLPPKARGFRLNVTRVGVAIACRKSKGVRGFKVNRSVREIERSLGRGGRVGTK